MAQGRQIEGFEFSNLHIYYDEREYATTRDTEYNLSKTNRGINLGVTGVKNIFDSSPDSARSQVSIGSGGTASLEGSQSYNGAADDDDGINASNSFNNTVNSTANGVINNFTNADNKGIRARLNVGVSSSAISGDETRVTKSSKVDIDGMPVGNRPRGLADMRRSDYVRAGRECGYDYVFVLTMSSGKGRVYGHDYVVASGNTVTKNTWLRVRLVDVNSGNYLYRNDIPAMGKTHNGHINGRVLERSVAKAMQEAMDDISVSER